MGGAHNYVGESVALSLTRRPAYVIIFEYTNTCMYCLHGIDLGGTLGMECSVLVLGIGNTLLSDDGVGVHVIRALENGRSEEDRGGPSSDARPVVRLRDAGTVGLALLPEIAAAESLIVVDATNFGGEAGEVQLFEAENMDAVLGNARLTPHEISLSDLVSAARLTQSLPARRVLVAIQPVDTTLGLDPTSPVAAAIPVASEAVNGIIERWLT